MNQPIMNRRFRSRRRTGRTVGGPGVPDTDGRPRVGRNLRVASDHARRRRDRRRGNAPGWVTPTPIRPRATLIRDLLAEVVQGRDAMNIPGAWSAMAAAIRNLGRPGIASMAISAVDAALWDLKARLLDLPLVTLLGAVRDDRRRSMAAADSPRTRSSSFRSSSPAGSPRASHA